MIVFIIYFSISLDYIYDMSPSSARLFYSLFVLIDLLESQSPLRCAVIKTEDKTSV